MTQEGTSTHAGAVKWSFLLGLFCLALILVHVYRKNGIIHQSYPFPPGPPSKPFIGNILSFKPQGAWYALSDYKSLYGDLVFFQGLGNTILVLNSLKVINDLLDKRADIYSDRPVFTVVGELMGLGQSLPLLPYGKEWRESRKLAHVALSQPATKKYHRIQENMAALLNKALLEDPSNFFAHVRLTSGRIILALTYGLSVEDADDKYIVHAEETMELIGKATIPGAFLCDLLPIMKYLPSWVPFQREAAQGRAMIESLVTKPYEHVKREIAEGTASPSLTFDLLSGNPVGDVAQFEHRVKWTTGALYGAGGETTYATVLCFILAMALHPDKQNRAQEEISRIVGDSRLPVIQDRENLPYVNAIIKEVMRWHPSLPLSIARMSTQDDVYNGYLIPKGTIIVPNVWAIVHTHDESYDPYSFIPERFLHDDAAAPDPARWAFGFGRRICPGKLVAENSVFVMISGILSAFDIQPPINATLNPTFGMNLVSYPDPFKCQIIPRSTEKKIMIRMRANEC